MTSLLNIHHTQARIQTHTHTPTRARARTHAKDRRLHTSTDAHTHTHTHTHTPQIGKMGDDIAKQFWRFIHELWKACLEIMEKWGQNGFETGRIIGGSRSGVKCLHANRLKSWKRKMRKLWGRAFFHAAKSLRKKGGWWAGKRDKTLVLVSFLYVCYEDDQQFKHEPSISFLPSKKKLFKQIQSTQTPLLRVREGERELFSTTILSLLKREREKKRISVESIDLAEGITVESP